jgi:hypothetical protein
MDLVSAVASPLANPELHVPCPSVPRSLCPSVPESSIPLSLAPLSLCPAVPLSLCPSVPESLCPLSLCPLLLRTYCAVRFHEERNGSCASRCDSSSSLIESSTVFRLRSSRVCAACREFCDEAIRSMLLCTTFTRDQSEYGSYTFQNLPLSWMRGCPAAWKGSRVCFAASKQVFTTTKRAA